MVNAIADWVLGLDPVLVLVVAGLLVFLEDAIFIGFAVPGETAAVLAGVTASFGRVPLAVAIVVVVVCAVLGDTVGYEVGRRIFGPRILGLRILDRHRERLDRAQDLLRRRGGLAVFLGRWTAFFRAMMPALAGASGMRYRTFLLWNAIGGIAWGTLFVVIGDLAGSSYHAIEKQAGRYAAVGVAVVVVALLVVWQVRRHRSEPAG